MSAGLNFIVEGAAADEAAEALAEVIQQELNYRVELKPELPDTPKNGERGLDPVAAAALVVAIPGAVLAVVDLVDRLKKKKQADATLERAREIASRPEVTIRVELPDGTRIELSQVTTQHLLDTADGDRNE